MKENINRFDSVIYLLLRLVMGFIFIWSFFDKTIGLGFSTSPEKAWINGGSPTTGFLSSLVEGPFASIFHSMSGVIIVDWLFMLGLLFVGISLLFNKYIKWGCLAGSLMMFFMYLALLFPANNPLIDEHIVYILVLIILYLKFSPSRQ